MLLREVQARPLQGHHLRALRRRGDPPEGAPRAHGSHRPRRARLAHLVLQGRPEPHRLPARHRSQGAREGPLLRGVHRRVGRRREAPGRPRRAVRQGRGRGRAARGRPRGAVRRGRGAPAAPPRVLRVGRDRRLRRGRRVLGAHARRLGRRPGLPAARGGARARQRRAQGRRPAHRRRGHAQGARARPLGRRARGPAALGARARRGRGLGQGCARRRREGASPTPARARARPSPTARRRSSGWRSTWPATTTRSTPRRTTA